MSRASGASFAQFFPAAPKAAKERAKERVKSKAQGLESPNRPAADIQVVYTTSRIDDVGSLRPAADNHHSRETALPPAEDDESLPGDILNGVGSASSHSSTVSSVFSAAAQHPNLSTLGTSRNVSSLTPLTNNDSSPTRITSPGHYKSGAQRANATDFTDNNLPHAQSHDASQNHTLPRILARDPALTLKGNRCTYDPTLDTKLASNERRKAKPLYKEFGLVRIYNLLGGVIFVRMSG